MPSAQQQQQQQQVKENLDSPRRNNFSIN